MYGQITGIYHPDPHFADHQLPVAREQEAMAMEKYGMGSDLLTLLVICTCLLDHIRFTYPACRHHLAAAWWQITLPQ